MTWLDTYLQNRRIARALKHITGMPALLDIGCHHGELLLKAKDIISSGTGIDPHCNTGSMAPHLLLINGVFPGALPVDQRFDCITALALLEHIPSNKQPEFMQACFQVLNNHGKLILTVPDAKVDEILNILTKVKLVAGMSLEEHFGFDATATGKLAIEAGFKLLLHKRFQFGLNNLFVFVKENGK